MRKILLFSAIGLLSGCSWFSPTPSTTHAPTPPPAQSGIATSSHQSADIAAVQRKLGVKDDGVWGPKSIKATKDYQRDNGLPITGQADAATLDRMDLTASEPVTTSPAPQ